ncbi:MAG: polysaccharide biosynthesis C-terminal domain-containing protein [Nitrobacter sp.]|uniref:polysaccharide biosynthesis C-terminal domain-containing protein n=1 Tax=Nitrobacter sp. TaxID=29420 RepID=UPI0026348FB3|nr:polysaccharide biosynthesis C-terminal domain-containing protein [Nitrobacter sp.]MCV0386476.1 polysaccharide biosynthesis C-terminal domain-containing protein [Nitrobacter sp.]
MRVRLLSVLRRPTVLTAGVAMVLRGATLASRFLLSILLARMLSPSDMGEYGLITAMLAFGLFVLGLEFYSYTLRELVPAAPAKRVQIIADQIVLASVSFAVISIGAVVAGLMGLLPKTSLLLFLLVLVTENASLEAMRILIITSRVIHAYIAGFLRGGIWVYALGLLMCWEPSTRSLEMVLIWWAGGGLLAVVYSVLCLLDLPWRNFRRYRPDLGWILAGLRTAGPFMLTAVSALMLSYIDRFFIDGFVGRDGLGIYTFYSTILIGILSLGTSISHQFLPRIISGHSAGADAYRRIIVLFLVSMLVAAGGLVFVTGVTMGPLLRLFNLRNYAESISVFYLMLPGLFLRMLADVPSYALYAAHSDKALLLCNITAAAVAIVSNIVLVPIFGIGGAALSGTLASVTLFLCLGAIARDRIRNYRSRSTETVAISSSTHIW